MKSLKLVAVLLLLGGISFGQASFYSGVAQTTTYINGTQASTPLPSAQILVCPFPGSCTSANKAVLYTDQTATVTASNPFFSDANGNFGFWGKSGNYQYVISSVFGTFGPYTLSIGGAGAAVITTNLAGLPADGAGTEGTLYNLTNGWQGLGIYKNGHARAQEPEINVQDFGARGDGGWYGGANCVSGSGSISNVGLSSGRLPKVGDTFQASTCGPAGGPLSCTITGGTATTGTPFGTAICGGGVTASANVTGSPAYWGASTDDTSAFQAAVNYCGATATGSGCTVKVPAGTFFVSNVTFPTTNGTNRIYLQGMGRGASNIVMTGAAQSCTLKAPANSMPIGVSRLSFLGPKAVTATDPIAMCWYGGTQHFFNDNAMNSGYIMVSAANTWINHILGNICTAATYCVEFGGSAGTGPVNTTWVQQNEMTGFNVYAIYTHTNSASWSNTFGPNSFEDDTTAYTSIVYMSDNNSVFEQGYIEVQAPTGGYYVENHGNNNTLRWRQVGCMLNLQGARIEANGGNGSIPCVGHNYFVFQTGGSGGSTFTGLGPQDVDAVLSGDRFVGGSFRGLGATDALGPNQGGGNAVVVYPRWGSSVFDWGAGRLDIAGIPYGFSDATTNNPSLPTSFGTSATIPLNSRIANKFPSAGFPWGFAFHICTKNPGPCTANPITAADWSHFGNIETRVRTEGTSYAPNGQAWRAGDWFWNNTPDTNFIMGWMNVAGGSPGTGLRQPITQTATATGCATAAAAGATCTTTVTWPTAFPDTSYKAVCDGQLITSGIPLDGGQTAKAAGTVTFQTVAATAAAAQFTNVHCAAWHD